MQIFARKHSIQAVSVLSDPVRTAIYDYLRQQDEPAGRDEVARELGLPRNTATFQLERLAKAGLVEVEFRKLGQATGPGSGRPSKLYTVTAQEVVASVPHREYTLAAMMMVQTIERASEEQRPIGELLDEVVRQTGKEIALERGALLEVLKDHGYIPESTPDGTVIMRSCPFHQLAAQFTNTVCAMNQELLSAVVEHTEAPYDVCRIAPQSGHCCVRLTPRDAN